MQLGCCISALDLTPSASRASCLGQPWSAPHGLRHVLPNPAGSFAAWSVKLTSSQVAQLGQQGGSTAAWQKRVRSSSCELAATLCPAPSAVTNYCCRRRWAGAGCGLQDSARGGDHSTANADCHQALRELGDQVVLTLLQGQIDAK